MRIEWSGGWAELVDRLGSSGMCSDVSGSSPPSRWISFNRPGLGSPISQKMAQNISPWYCTGR